MTARTSSLVHPKYKTGYRVRNWREYERCCFSQPPVTPGVSTRHSTFGSGSVEGETVRDGERGRWSRVPVPFIHR